MPKIQKHIILLAAILQWLGISVFAGEVHEIHFLKDSYASGERTVKSSGENAAMFVNAEFAGGTTNTAKFSLYVSPYLVANQGGRYTKHIYIGSQRIVSKLGDLKSYGADPRRIEYAGSESDGPKVDYKAKYALLQQVIKDNFAHFDVPYNGVDNNDYVDGKGFSERDGSLKGAMLKTASLKDNFQQGDSYEQYQYFYHSDHLGSSSFITNTEGEVVQHIEYVPYGEVFIEERNNVWNTPYLFNAKEFDEETGLYYYGARYYDSRLAIWYGVDALAEKYPNMSPYNYCVGNPVKFVDPDGNKIKGFKIMNGNVTITKSASKDAIKIYNTMSKTTIGLKAFKSMILVPTKIKIVVEDSDTDYMGLTVGSNNVTKEGYYKRATVHINLNSINSVGSRFEYEEEGVIATGVHESNHTTDLEQISIDRNRDIDAEDNNRSLYWENETKPMNAEYDARSEYREEMQLDNTKWKEIYESDKDSKGYSKPVFRGNNNQD